MTESGTRRKPAAQAPPRKETGGFGKIAASHAPDVGWNAAGGMQKHVKFHAYVHCRQSFVRNDQWGSLRGKHGAEENQDRNEANGLGEIHARRLILRRAQRKRTSICLIMCPALWLASYVPAPLSARSSG